MNKILKNSATLLKVLLGAFFVFSALSKFVDMDALSVYIYSFGIFSFNLSIVASWLLVSFELILGTLLISNRWHRLVSLSSLLLTVAFTIFLVYVQLIGRVDSCHCLGEMVPFNPVQSMLKNAVLILVILFVWKFADPDNRIRWWVPVLSVVACAGIITLGGFSGWVSMTFIDLQYTLTLALCVLVVGVLLTTRWYSKWWSMALVALVPTVAILVLSVAATWIHTDSDSMVDQTRFTSAISEDGPLSGSGIGEGRKVVCILSRTCAYCRKASRIVSFIQKNNDLPEEDFVNVFPGNDTVGIARFYADDAVRYQEHVLTDTLCFMITRYQVPLVMLVEDGIVKSTYGHSDISEQEMVEFLTKQD